MMILFSTSMLSLNESTRDEDLFRTPMLSLNEFKRDDFALNFCIVCTKTHKYIWTHLDYISYCVDYPVERCGIKSNSLWLHVVKSI